MVKILSNTFAKHLKDGKFIDEELIIKPLSESKPQYRLYQEVSKLNNIFEFIALTMRIMESPCYIKNIKHDFKTPDSFKEERDKIKGYVKKITICIACIEGIHSASPEDAKWMIEQFIENLWISFSREDIKYINKRCEDKVYESTRLVYWHNDNKVVKEAAEKERQLKNRINELQERIKEHEVDAIFITKRLELQKVEFCREFQNINKTIITIEDIEVYYELMNYLNELNNIYKDQMIKDLKKELDTEQEELRKYFGNLKAIGFKPILETKLFAEDIWSACYAELLSDIESKWPIFKCSDDTCYNHDKYYVGEPFPSTNGVFCSPLCRDRVKLRRYRKKNK